MVAAHQDSALSASSLRARLRVGLPAGRGVRLAFLVAWASVLVVGSLATVDAFDLGADFAVAAWTSGLWMIGLTIAGGLRDVRAAEARTSVALERAMAAETAQRARADELSEILRASEGLVLTGEGKLDFVNILAAITPAGCTSLLACVDGESESVVVAAHGSLELDPDALKQVLLNLLNNAVDAMPRGGELLVSTRTEDDRVRIVVADTGTGMDAGIRNRIFTPFFSTRAAGGGNGLGLSVSLQIVEGLGGTIEVQSAPGEGATFTVWLPLSWPTSEGAVTAATVDPGSVAGSVSAAAAGTDPPGVGDATQAPAVGGSGRQTGFAA